MSLDHKQILQITTTIENGKNAMEHLAQNDHTKTKEELKMVVKEGKTEPENALNICRMKCHHR